MYLISPNLIHIIFNSMNLVYFVEIEYWPIVYGLYELITLSSINILLGIVTMIIERCDYIAEKEEKVEEKSEKPEVNQISNQANFD